MRVEWLALGVSVIAAVALLAWVLLRCQSGFDFTDEGFYLNWISSPQGYRDSVSQFGFAYHPLYRIVGGNIALLRQLNVLTIFASAFALCIALIQSIVSQQACLRWPQYVCMIASALIVAAGSLTFFDLWLPTPSYNSLNFLSLILTSIGVLLARDEVSKRSVVGWILVGVGGGLSFLAKPTSAAVLTFLVAAYLLVAGKFRIRGILISALVAVLVLTLSALAIDGSIASFKDRIVNGMRLGSYLSSNQSFTVFLRVDSFTFSLIQKASFASLFAIAFIVTLLSGFANAAARLGAALIALVLAGLTIAVSVGAVSPNISHEPFQPMQFWAITLAATLSLALPPKYIYRSLPRSSLALIGFFIVLPFAYAFGTGNNYWEQASRAGLFWLLAGLVASAELAARGASLRGLVPFAATALIVPSGVLFAAMENPYRQTQSLRLQLTTADLGLGNSKLFLAADAAIYIRGLKKLSTDNGFRAGDPMLDLTGVSPGSIYALGARAPGTAWTLGGYPGSTDFLTAALDQETCDAIAASWILIEVGSSSGFSFDSLRRYGINISSDYLTVGSVSSTRSFIPQKFEHRLLKPARTFDVARQACERAKQKSG
jgi:hypothetical protein